MNHVQIALRKLLDSGLSQMEIARRTGMSQTRVHRWSNDGIPASANYAVVLVELAKSLDLTTGQSASAEKTEGSSS